MKGVLLVVEGIGGSGKSTLMDKVENWAIESSVPYVRTREPGGTPGAEVLRKLCREGFPDGDHMSDTTRALLFNAARCENVLKVILPAMLENKLVICDRFVDSTFAIQGTVGGMDMKVLKDLHRISTGNLFADFTFLLDAEVEVCMGRVSTNEKSTDFFDSLAVEKQKRIRQGFLNRFAHHISQDKYQLLDAAQNEDQVFAQALPTLMKIRETLFKRPVGELLQEEPS